MRSRNVNRAERIVVCIPFEGVNKAFGRASFPLSRVMKARAALLRLTKGVRNILRIVQRNDYHWVSSEWRTPRVVNCVWYDHYWFSYQMEDAAMCSTIPCFTTAYDVLNNAAPQADKARMLPKFANHWRANSCVMLAESDFEVSPAGASARPSNFTFPESVALPSIDFPQSPLGMYQVCESYAGSRDKWLGAF